MTQAEGNVGLAFGLVVAAGLSTTIGACFVFCTSLASRRFLAASLGASAGVMLYVSFAEIFCIKAVDAFEDAGSDNPEAKRWATLSFFGGVIITVILDVLVHAISHSIRQKDPEFVPTVEHAHDFAADQPLNQREQDVNLAVLPDHHPHRQGEDGIMEEDISEDLTAVVTVSETETGALKAKADKEFNERSAEKIVEVGGSSELSKAQDSAAPAATVVTTGAPAASVQEMLKYDDVEPVAVAAESSADEYSGLGRMGTMTAIAIAIHNFPEGLATFVATLADESLGVAIAIAIALHNIPEGACVAVPVYFATGSRTKGFVWAFLSGLSEIIGAIVGYAILGNGLDKNAEGILFGIVAGMMVYISLAELLPTAFKYDERGWLATASLFVGMAIMALSLLAFEI